MQMSESDVLSVRLSRELHKKLSLESNANKITVNKLLNEILENHIKHLETGDYMSRMFFSDKLLSELLSLLDRKTILHLAETIGKQELRTAIQFTFGKVDFDSVRAFMENWMQMSKLLHKHVFENGQSKLIIQHNFGEKWSTYFMKIMESIYEEISCKLEEKSTLDQCCSYSVKRITKGDV